MKKFTVVVVLLFVGACAGEITGPGPAVIAEERPKQPEKSDTETAKDTPKLSCDPLDSFGVDRCDCMAQIVCAQMYYCLGEAGVAVLPNAEWIQPETTCEAELREDCMDDLGDSDEHYPDDFAACLYDLEGASCSSYGEFQSVSNDFPASCENLRALDTGLGISL